MDFQQANQGKIMIKLKNINQKLIKIVQDYSFQAIFRTYKEISKQICNFIKYIQICNQVHGAVYQEIRRCVQILSMIVAACQGEKYGERFCYFVRIIRKYQSRNKLKVQITSQQKLFERVQKNEQSSYFNKLNSWIVGSQQIRFLKSVNYQKFVNSLAYNSVILTNYQCVCCSSVFIKDLQITNHNPQYPVLIGLSSNIGFDKYNLGKYINAVLNAQGGAIIIGAQKKLSKIIPSGVILSETERERILVQIKQSIILNSPPQTYDYKIDLIRIHNSYMNSKKIIQQKDRFCVRILVSPLQSQKVNFLQFKKKGYHNTFQIYDIQGERNIKKIISNDQHQNFYNFVHKTYRQTKKKQMKLASRTNSHQFIKSSVPYNLFSQVYVDYSNKNQPIQQQLASQEQTYTIDVKKCFNDEPTFKYSHNSLLIVSSSKNQRYLNDLQCFLKEKRQFYVLQKPFSQSFNQNGRCIWLISHQKRHSEFKSLFKSFDQKVGTIILMPIYRSLQIQKSKMSEQVEKSIKKNFLMRYQRHFKSYVEQTKDQSTQHLVKKVYFEFDCFSEAIYTYMLFQERYMKPYFIKQGTVYSKKKKQNYQ